MNKQWIAPEHLDASPVWERVEAALEACSPAQLDELTGSTEAEETKLRNFFKKNRSDVEETLLPTSDPRNAAIYYMGRISDYDGGEPEIDRRDRQIEGELAQRFRTGEASAPTEADLPMPKYIHSPQTLAEILQFLA